MDELKKFVKKIVKNRIEYYAISNNNDECKKIIENMFSVNYRDSPDGYIYDKKNNIVYIYEHFEIDCSQHNKKGSKLRRNLAKIKREVNREMDDNNEGEILKNIEQGYSTKKDDGTIVFEIGKNGEKYRNNYINNFNDLFEKHHKQLKLYRDNCMTELGIYDAIFKFIFVIEDVTTGGTYYLNGRGPGQQVIPLFTKQFQEKLLNSNVDYLVFKSLQNSGLLTVLDKQYLIDEKVELSIDLEGKEFYVFPAMIQTTFYKKY